MDEVYRELIQLIKKLRNSDAWSQKDQDQRAQVVQDHLLEVHGRFVAQLGDWSGPFRSEDGEEYYFNEKTQFSTWVNPIDDCQNEISIRQAVLSRCLFPASGSQREDVPDSATVPTLHLPIGRGQEADAGAASFSSARSFYTARDSPRSASSPQSFSARSKGSESPPRIRSKGRPARALADLSPVSHQNQMQEQGLDDTRTTATSKASPKIQDATAMSSQESLCIETKTDQDHHGRDPCDGEMDLTFGCSTMPKFPIEELQAASPGGDRESDEPLAHDHVTPASLPPPSNTSWSQIAAMRRKTHEKLPFSATCCLRPLQHCAIEVCLKRPLWFDRLWILCSRKLSNDVEWLLAWYCMWVVLWVLRQFETQAFKLLGGSCLACTWN